MSTDDDPILVRRDRMRRLAEVGQRLGYLLFGLATVAFIVGFVGEYEKWLTSAIVACLVVGSVVLAPSIILGYAVRAADREDRERADER